MLRTALAAAIVAAFVAPAIADTVDGTIRTIDLKSGIVVMDDRTVWELRAELLPENLKAGDAVQIEYRSAGEDGLTAIDALTLLAPAAKS